MPASPPTHRVEISSHNHRWQLTPNWTNRMWLWVRNLAANIPDVSSQVTADQPRAVIMFTPTLFETQILKPNFLTCDPKLIQCAKNLALCKITHFQYPVKIYKYQLLKRKRLCHDKTFNSLTSPHFWHTSGTRISKYGLTLLPSFPSVRT